MSRKEMLFDRVPLYWKVNLVDYGAYFFHKQGIVKMQWQVQVSHFLPSLKTTGHDLVYYKKRVELIFP